MEAAQVSRPGSPATAGGPLQMATPDRINQCRESIFATLRVEGWDSSVTDKISQFNNLSAQSKHLERKTADAALKRAVLGREEAEGELRRLKEDMKLLQQAIDEGKERERRVGERLETIMENYGRAKETHAHTQALWEKEIRRARKENFKAQSSIVKLQEELKSARAAEKALEEKLQREKERSHVREQEAFQARYQIVSVQEQLDQALERIKLVEQERDAYKTAAKNEEIARLAAEGRIPLPAPEDPDDEFASPKKTNGRKIRCRDPRVSLTTMEIVSSAASELEIEQLAEQVQWERQRADRAQEMIEFMQAECQMHCCPCSKSKRRTSMLATRHTSRSSPKAAAPSAQGSPRNKGDEDKLASPSPKVSPSRLREPGSDSRLEPHKSRKAPRQSTIFCPKEGIFRTVSEQEAAELRAQREAEIAVDTQGREAQPEPPTADEEEVNRIFARTPSVEPPTFALLGQDRTSLMSLIDAPRGGARPDPMPTIYSIPTIPDDEPAQMKAVPHEAEEEQEEQGHYYQRRRSSESRPPISAAIYTVTTTTTVPVRDSRSSSSNFSQKLRTSSNCSNASFDLSDPAMTPTMTREEALAKIRERRGRAKSVAQGTITPHNKTVQGAERRYMSVPTGNVTSKPKRS